MDAFDPHPSMDAIPKARMKVATRL